LQMKYARIVAIFAKESGLALEDALAFFYDSDTYKLISEGVADMHCRSDEYLADELMMEYKETRESGGMMPDTVLPDYNPAREDGAIVGA